MMVARCAKRHAHAHILESAYRLGTAFFAALLVPKAHLTGQVAAGVCFLFFDVGVWV